MKKPWSPSDIPGFLCGSDEPAYTGWSLQPSPGLRTVSDDGTVREYDGERWVEVERRGTVIFARSDRASTTPPPDASVMLRGLLAEVKRDGGAWAFARTLNAEEVTVFMAWLRGDAQ